MAGSPLPLLLLPWLLTSAPRQDLQDAPQGGGRGTLLILFRCLIALLFSSLSIAIFFNQPDPYTSVEVAAIVLLSSSSLLSSVIEVFILLGQNKSVMLIIFDSNNFKLFEVVAARRGQHTSLLITLHWAFLMLALLPQVMTHYKVLKSTSPFKFRQCLRLRF